MARRIGLNLLFVEPGSTGGMETYARGLLPELSKARDDLEFVVLAGRDLAEDWRSSAWAPMEVLDLSPNRSRMATRGVLEQVLVPAATRRNSLDLVHSLSQIAPVFTGAKSVITVHDLIYRTQPETTSPVLHWGVRALVPRAARRADRIITPSRATAEDVVRHLGIDAAQVDVVESGPGLVSSVTPTPEAELRQRYGLGSQQVVLCVSPRRPHKNVGRLVDAISEIPGAMLVLPGYASGFDTGVRSKAQDLGVADRVLMPGWVSDEDLEGLYRSADLLAFPSLAEGFGLPVLEAMKRGLPVVASNIPAIAEVAGNAALLVDPQSASAIGEAIRNVLNDDELRRNLAESGRLRAKEFSWTRAAEGTIETYERALLDRRS